MLKSDEKFALTLKVGEYTCKYAKVCFKLYKSIILYEKTWMGCKTLFMYYETALKTVIRPLVSDLKVKRKKIWPWSVLPKQVETK